MSRVVLDWAVLTESFFITISLFWLGLMVMLAGNRRSMGTWLTSGGLLLGALFFTSHTAILGRGLSSTSFGMDFWWWVSWVPAIVAPLAWYGAMLWYAGYRLDRSHPHRAWLMVVVALGLCIALLLIFANPLPSYQYLAGRTWVGTPNLAGIPLLILAYLVYSLMCYLLPLDLLRRPQPAGPLETRARQRARAWLIGATLALLLAGVLLAWTAFWALVSRPIPSLAEPQTEQIVLRFDLAVQSLIAIAITLLGRAIVGFEVFTGRSLPRNRFFRHWRSTVLLAFGFGAVSAWTLAIELRPIYSLMLATALMTLFSALYSWQSFGDREAFMARLRPFITSQNLYGQLTRPQEDPAPSAAQLFETLCRDVLEIRAAILYPAGALATLAGPPLAYPAARPAAPPETAAWPARFQPGVRCLPVSEAGLGDETRAGLEWAIPLWSSRGLDGVLVIGEKSGGSPFTEEEIEIAQTAGERLLDLLAGSEMARLAMDLLRQRLAQARVFEGQGRRALHDEVLPQLHTALLYLSGSQAANPSVSQAMEALTETHRRISDLMREMPLATPHRLAQNGLAAALRTMVANDFGASFEQIEWHIDERAVEQARALPLFVNEVVYFAARELVRNAAVHGRGRNPTTPLCLTVRLEPGSSLRLVVEDSGVGYHPAGGPTGSQKSTGSGLRIHSAMLAAVGARLAVNPGPTSGTRAEISIYS